MLEAQEVLNQKLQQANAVLQVSEDKLAVTLNSIGDAVIATDAQARVTILNPLAEQLTGWTQAQAIGRMIDEVFQIINKETRLPATIPVMDALTLGTVQGLANHTVLIARDGGQCDIADSCSPIRDHDNQIVGAVLVFRDVTAEYALQHTLLVQQTELEMQNDELIRSEQALEAARSRYFDLYDRAPIGYFTVRESWEVMEANLTAATLLGVTREAMVNAPFARYILKRDADSFHLLCERLKATGLSQVGEFRMRKSDGTQIWVDLTAIAAQDESMPVQRIMVSNITARKQAEEALLKSGALQSAIFSSANFSSIATDAKGVIQIFNVGAERMLGYAAADVMNKITPADISDPQEVISRAASLSAELGTPITPGFEALVFKASRGIEDIYELTYIRKDGSRFAAVVSVTALRDAQDSIIGYLLIGTDNTARKQAEAALIKAGALQKAIFDSANFSSIATDAKGVIQIFNVGAERMLGYAAADVMNKITPADISDPQEVISRAASLSAELGTPITPGFEALVFKASRGIEDIYELTYIRKDGSRFAAVVSVTALRDAQDSIIGYLLIGTDNTARKQIEEERKKLDQRLRDQQFYTRSLIEANIDAIMTTDPAGIITDVNRQMESLTDCTRDELIGAPFKKYFTDPERAEAAINLALNDKKVTNYELTARTRGGQETVVSYNAVTFYDRDRNLQGVFAAARDVTERKRIDLVLKEKNVELEGARLLADSSNLAKSDFLANMSHEIRSPLNAILGLAYLLEQTQLDQSAHTMVQRIRSSGSMLLGIISDILDVSKIEAGQLEIEQAPFDLAAVIDHVAVAMGLAIGEKDIELIVFPLPQGISHIVGDALRLQQVLVNLSSNAAKFTQAGRIELRMDLINSADGAELLRFCVQDTGMGIAPEMQSSVFTAFSQADTSTTRRFGGTGLGLTICRQLVRLMGGEIGVDSVPGVGSEFWFTLPVQRADAAQYSSPFMVCVEALIADDNPIALEAIGAAALNLGWQISCVDSGAAVMAHLLGSKAARLPGVVVLDWKMPGMDGLATARTIREGVAQSECPIVLMGTPSALATLVDQPGAEMVDAVLAKPVTPSCLYNAVMQAWRRRANLTGNAPVQIQAVSAGLAGVHVLVVDDSDINRDVARRILEGEGAVVTLAADGQLAIDWLLSHPLEVDLVLMDVQMPVLDGMEATRRLRRMPQFDDLPIVALTAGAFKSQQQAAMAAGMTEFVSKPFDVPLTIALILRLRRPSSLVPAYFAQPAMPVEPVPVSLVGQDGGVASAVMDVAHGLKLWTDVPTYQSYLRRFVGGYSDVVGVMRAAVLQGARSEVVALAHKLSGVAANLALADTRMAALELERVLGMQDDPTPALDALDVAVAAVITEIHRYAPPVSEAADTTLVPLTDEQPTDLKAKLLELLSVLDSDNASLIKKRLSALNPLLPPQAGAAILACVLGYDFRGAEAATRQFASDNKIDLWE